MKFRRLLSSLGLVAAAKLTALPLQVIKEVFFWTREPMEVRRIAARKEEILTEILGDMQPLLVPDIPAFMDGLSSNKVSTCGKKFWLLPLRRSQVLVGRVGREKTQPFGGYY